MAAQSNLKTKLNTKINTISSKVGQAEKAAEKHIRNVLKSTEHYRAQQMKNVQQLLKQARGLRQTALIQKAEQVRKDVESVASAGLEMLLAKLQVPTRKEIDRLNKKVASLQKRIDDIKK